MPTKSCPSCSAALPRKTRQPNEYNKFVGNAMKDEAIKALPNTQRFGAISKKWKEHKSSMATSPPSADEG